MVHKLFFAKSTRGKKKGKTTGREPSGLAVGQRIVTALLTSRQPLGNLWDTPGLNFAVPVERTTQSTAFSQKSPATHGARGHSTPSRGRDRLAPCWHNLWAGDASCKRCTTRPRCGFVPMPSPARVGVFPPAVQNARFLAFRRPSSAHSRSAPPRARHRRQPSGRSAPCHCCHLALPAPTSPTHGECAPSRLTVPFERRPRSTARPRGGGRGGGAWGWRSVRLPPSGPACLQRTRKTARKAWSDRTTRSC